MNWHHCHYTDCNYKIPVGQDYCHFHIPLVLEESNWLAAREEMIQDEIKNAEYA